MIHILSSMAAFSKIAIMYAYYSSPNEEYPFIADDELKASEALNLPAADAHPQHVGDISDSIQFASVMILRFPSSHLDIIRQEAALSKIVATQRKEARKIFSP
mmetsp:Transcript_756/g.1172  ORF Transcript_756/g.1172 Transcript_756/m.1172 type:complete len:103 (+) Transcript_756:653-961(+)